ncbi:MAG: ATP-dependent protease subunit HslV [Acidobacteria bacterium]|nr:ATP-dependent protease subunit HslV [Acidobacteriota bacterium]
MASLQDRFHGTTVILVRREGHVAMASDGQVTVGETIIKQTARKMRRLYNDRVLAGFAGATADAFALFGRFESKLEEYHGNLGRAAVELAKDWRTDRSLRHLEALMIVTDEKNSYLISGTGDIIEPDDGVIAIGSGGAYALAASRALMQHTKMGAREVAAEALRIAGAICIYTNQEIYVEEL